MTEKAGVFITVEGVEGVGKTTNMAFVQDYLQAHQVSLTVTREPGGTALAEQIRDLLLANHEEVLNDDAELLLVFAARAQHLGQLIKPVLAEGGWVLSDRFTDSSYAYQGGGRGLDINRISQLESWVMQDFTPDMTLLLDVPVEIGMSRVESRGKKDRIEMEKMDFFDRVRQAYIARSKEFPDRIKLIDSSKTIEHTTEQIATVLDTL